MSNRNGSVEELWLTDPRVQHFSRDTLSRVILRNSPRYEAATVVWHLQHCALCREQITGKELLELARQAKDHLVKAMRSAVRN